MTVAVQPRVFMRVALVDRAEPEAGATRAPTDDDIVSLGALMSSAYFDTIDDEGETPEQAAEEVRKTFEGGYGQFDPQCSALIEKNGRILSAALITRFQGRPFVAFSMTDPAVKRQGLSRACLCASMVALRRRGESELRLVVTLANTAAVDLYSSLGFKMDR